MSEPTNTPCPTSCMIWTLTRRDGLALRLTNHDQPLVIGGDLFEPGLSLDVEAFRKTTDLTIVSSSVDGAINSDGIRAEDVSAGLWDFAQIDVKLADWSGRTVLTHIWSGRFSEVSIENGEFSAELVSLKVDLERVIGRNYARLCDAILGDARCGVDLSLPEHAGKTCDQRFETCVGRFANGERFRGCPHMPGNDFILAGPGGS